MSLLWLNNVSGVYFIQISLLLIGQQDLGHFFRYRPLFPIGWRIVQILRQRRRKTTNAESATLGAIQKASNPLLAMYNYTPQVISRNDKNMQLALLSQRKLTLKVSTTEKRGGLKVVAFDRSPLKVFSLRF